MNNLSSKVKTTLIVATTLILALGLYMRFYQITANDFVFYDEGYYMNYNRFFHLVFLQNTPDNPGDFVHAFFAWAKLALASGKALWFFIVDTRVFLGLYDMWSFPRLISAIAGVAAITMTYIFAKRFYGGKEVALLSVALLAVLPSHVFYSRLGLQESFSTLCFLLGFYFYLYPRKFGWRTVLSAFFFACVFFSNYRMIILPLHVLLFDWVLCYCDKRSFDVRKYVWHGLIFAGLIFGIGALEGGSNTVITFAWMFNQASFAEEKVSFINFFSFPYYIFRLEHTLFGLLFFGNIFLLLRKEFSRAIPFMVVCLHMFIFSFAGEKGARYMAVMMPFLAMSAAMFFHYIFMLSQQKPYRWGLAAFLTLTFCLLSVKSLVLTHQKSDYRQAMEYLKAREGEDPKVISTQRFITNLYVKDPKHVISFSRKFRKYLEYNTAGYKYLLVCPQAYVSFTEDNTRFNPRLIAFLGFIDQKFKPIKEFEHFNGPLLERFVFEHSTNLAKSIQFLNENQGRYGRIRIYDVPQTVSVIDQFIDIETMPLNPAYETKRESDLYGR